MGKIRLLTLVILCFSFLTASGQTVKPQKFGPDKSINAGVNIHFISGHEKDLDMIAAAGFRFIRMDFIWHEIEKSRGIYDWSAYDELTSNLEKRGLRALFILDYSNPLYEPEVGSKDPITGEAQIGIAAPCHQESIDAFARWAATAAERYKDKNIVWEIWNEPNITFWRPAPDVNQYLKLAFASSKAIRSADPGAIIIGPATSQIPLPFIESFLASGILEYIDGVSVHPYREYSKSPETAIEDYQKVNELIIKYSPAGKDIPIISSEWGYASATKGVSLEKQASFIVRMQLSNLLYGVPVSVWYDWKNDGTQPGNFEHNCGTVTYDLEPKLAYIAIKNLNDQLRGFTLLKRISLNNENDFALIFMDENGRTKMAAWTTEDPHSVILENNIPEATRSITADWRGGEMKVKTEGNRLILDLSEYPQYIALPSGWN
ncbi:MAG: cellulase family glycosylhydrolase [Bacteroidia bacterium]|nr:cellulase family glycosylhydrolase [Bacteroidia bacterium]